MLAANYQQDGRPEPSERIEGSSLLGGIVPDAASVAGFCEPVVWPLSGQGVWCTEVAGGAERVTGARGTQQENNDLEILLP